LAKWGLVALFAAGTVFADGERIDWTRVPEVRGESEVRAFLEDVLQTRYCGDAMVEAGLGPMAALEGKAPVGNRGFAKADEADWFPVALAMAREEMERLRQADADGQGGEASLARLAGLAELLARSSGHREEALGFLAPLATEEWEGVPGGLADRLGRDSGGYWEWWLRQSDLATEEGVGKCLALVKEYVARRGADAKGNHEFCVLALRYGMARCGTREGTAALARHVLWSMERFPTHLQCKILDSAAVEGGFEGWRGSLQRRRLAERFIGEKAPLMPVWHDETHSFAQEPTEQSRNSLLSRRAAMELAAEEKDLTDLREVYGDWREDGRSGGTEP
jgi:hypothetical protein